MASGLVIHIESGADKHTEVLTTDRILIGTSDKCDVRIRSGDLPTAFDSPSELIDIYRSNGYYRISNVSSSISADLNGRSVEPGVAIKDGDLVHFGECRLTLQFFLVGGLPATVPARTQETHVAPFIENAALESAATARRDDAKVFLREFTRELVREIRTSTKLISLLIACILVGGILYLGFGLYNELQRSRKLINDQAEKINRMNAQVDRTQSTISQINQTNNEIRDSLSLAPKLRNDYGAGVCLISGSFYFIDKATGRSLRYPETQTSEDGNAIQNANQSAQYTVEGNGAIAEFEFVGTGFYVGGGFVLTNRHVAQPWIADERAKSILELNGQARIRKLVAFFPGHTEPVAIKLKQFATKDDLAVCTSEANDLPPNLPTLPFDQDSDAVVVGKQVVMMGYPSGPDRLIALLDDAEARNVQARYGASLESLLDYLASRNRIQPLTTQGHITDLDVRRIVYDARTAEGGSGAPLFGTSGRVIGVNFAVFTENSASNFAIPARYAVTLLEKSGWKPVEAPSEANSQSSSNQNSNRSTAAAPNTR